MEKLTTYPDYYIISLPNGYYRRCYNYRSGPDIFTVPLPVHAKKFNNISNIKRLVKKYNITDYSIIKLTTTLDVVS